MANALAERVKLTPDLYQTFRRYKKATGAVVTWLAADQDGSTWSLDDLMQAARASKTKNRKIPPDISYAFELAIRARTEISGYFTQKPGIKDASTLSHEYFTKKLRSIYKLLRGPQHAVATNPSLSTLEPQPTSIFANAFEQLTLIAPENESSSSQNSTSEVLIEDTAGPSFILKDDDLARDFELFHVVSSLELTCAKIKECWAKAADGSMSMLFAAWLTTAAFRDARSCFNGGPVSVSLDVGDHLEIYKKYTTLLEVAVNEDGQRGSLISDTLPFFRHGLKAPWEAFLDSQGRTYTKKELSESVLQKPGEHVTVETETDGREKAERSLMDLLLRSIRRLLYQNGDKPSDLTLAMNPLLQPLQIFYETKGSSIQTELVFGLHLLVESYKSFTLPKRLVAVNIPNSRLQMLKFAQDVKSSLSHARLLRPFLVSIACDCNNCIENAISVALIKFEKGLADLATERRFDLYYQAPWVAGDQMSEILSRVTGLGLRLCNRRQYLGTVLHLYNMLRQFDAIDKETILLENLCTVLAQGVFSGSRPDCNFFAKYAAFMGGRLSFDRSKRYKRTPNGEVCSCCGDKIEPSNWRITMPKHCSTKLNSHDISTFDGLYCCQFQLGCHCWPHVWHGLDKGKNATNKQISQARDELSVHPCASILDHLEGVVGAEFKGVFPVAKINWLEIYITCTDILANLSRAVHSDPECPHEYPYNDEGWPRSGQFLVMELLELAENFPDKANDDTDFVATYWPKAEVSKKAIRMALAGKKTTDFLWAV